MLNDEIRTRLAALLTSSRAAPAIADSANRARHTATAPDSIEQAGLIDEADPFSAAEECENSSGRHLRFRRPLAAVWPSARQLTRRPIEADRLPASTHPELAAVAEHFPRDTLFLDLETCGFAGSPVFLAGLAWQVDGELALDQLFARDYAEERAILETLWQVAARNRVLVTFNGKSFDWPMVHDRSTRHHLGRDARGQGSARPAGLAGDSIWVAGEPALGRRDPRPQLAHCDLLHHARRRWKGLLPNCKLQTLERYVCRRERSGDLAGSEVPLAYHEFVRSGRAQQIAAILHHNALDLAALVQIALRLLQVAAAPRG